jgi:hypothetical protein
VVGKLEEFESEVILGFGHVHLVGEDISFEKNFIGSHSLPPLWSPNPVLQGGGF